MVFNSSKIVRVKICFLFLIILLAVSNSSAGEIPIREQEEIARKQIAEWLDDVSYGDPLSVEKQKAIKTQLEEIQLYYHHKSWLPIIKMIYGALDNYHPKGEENALDDSNEENDFALSDSEEPNSLNKKNDGKNVITSRKCDAEEYKISEVLHHGKIIVLRNGTKFLIDRNNMKETSKWGHADEVMICKSHMVISGNSFEYYELANSDNDFNDFVNASLMD
jgi:hypothetical protein